MDWLNYHHLLYFWTVAQAGSVTKACERAATGAADDQRAVAAIGKTRRRQALRATGPPPGLDRDGPNGSGLRGRDLLPGPRVAGRAGRAAGRAAAAFHGGRARRPAQADHLPHPRTGAETARRGAVGVRRGEDRASLRGVCRTRTGPAHRRFARRARGARAGLQPPAGRMRGLGVRRAGLAAKYTRGFPQSLNDAPMLLPTRNTLVRRSLDQWFDAQGIRPRIAGEIEDSALLKTFGQAGLGLFVGIKRHRGRDLPAVQGPPHRAIGGGQGAVLRHHARTAHQASGDRGDHQGGPPGVVRLDVAFTGRAATGPFFGRLTSIRQAVHAENMDLSASLLAP